MSDPVASAKSGGELRQRVISALVLAAIVLAVTWWGGWPFRIAWALVAGLVAFEWMTIVSRHNAVAAAIGLAVAGTLLGFSSASPIAFAGVGAGFALLAAIATPLVSSRLALEVCGIAYAAAFAVVPTALREIPEIGLVIILWTFAVVWFTDIAAYFTGRGFGGPKLMPHISPNKTWSGAIGGLVAGTLGGWLVWRLSPAAMQAIPLALVLAATMVASIASQAGDLFESALKRRFATKDSSGFIPGHGGFLDRLDGYWAVLVLAGLALFLAHIEF